MKIEEFKTRLQNKEFKCIKDFYEKFSLFKFSNDKDYSEFIGDVSRIIEETNQKNLLTDVTPEINPNDDLEFITSAAKIVDGNKSLPPLEYGEIDITNLPSNCHMLEFDPIITKHICKLGHAKYWNRGAPVTIVADGIKKYKALEAGCRYFDSIPEIIDFLKANKNKLVYTINYFTFKKKYSIRTFGDYDWSIGTIQYYYTKFRFWMNSKRRD